MCRDGAREHHVQTRFWKRKVHRRRGKVGRKEGYRKSDDKLQEEYAGVIKQLRRGYPIRMIAKNEGVSISTVQRMKKKFVDVANRKEAIMGRTKCKVDYMMEYGEEIELLSSGFSLRRVRSRTGRAINTLRKLRAMFLAV